MTSALTFQNTHFDVIEQHNQLWLSASDIANALGYKSPKSISNIYARYSDEFSQGMTLVINLMTNGINGSKRRNETRIFSLRGAHLIAMFARTAIAKQFRKWVLDILDNETKTQTIIPITTPSQIPKANWPITYQTDWKPATITLFGKTAHYVRFELRPKPFSCEFSAKHTPQVYQAVFHFADQYQRPSIRNEAPMIGDVGYFESTRLDDLWVQVINFAARCNSQCALL
ncbi:BRO-N domain-containing protein [Vibrio cholerae]|uniref:BRO-N domain-containing protein n=1 Tax=Vibrio cholerae TaxID=666 RepID=UPI0011D39237|nr:Bro-N domain-containing protein [Vibrio cholerae]EKC3495403.1 Bro-N domain-containing protein [Vibrio cholerae]MCX9473562.1 Bro-N domain-containing protein [Vibrio cholerae]MCX9476683.1 Bro-N domain-containing protein [Vibrio cholerae]TXX34555.1 Bro-N domain-containing protein [Vibrio cholerae]GHW67949.1 BRO family, N- domain protein [Vibrio cholerae]